MKVEAIGGFDWDETNIGKLAVHGLAPADVEDLFDFCAPVVFQHPEHHERWLALGVLDERFLLVSFELDEETRWVRVVTAFEPVGSKWWRIMPRAKASKRSKSEDERQVDAAWGGVDFEMLESARLDLDPVLRERIRSRDKLVQLTLRVGVEQIAEAKREAATSNKKYQAILRQWLAEGATRARTERLKHREHRR